jgi:hypothetical protein
MDRMEIILARTAEKIPREILEQISTPHRISYTLDGKWTPGLILEAAFMVACIEYTTIGAQKIIRTDLNAGDL